MAQTGYTPILIYSSSTASNAPAVGNLTNSTLGSELAINIIDGKLFYKDNANAIQVIGWKVRPATAGGTGLTSFAVGDTIYADTTTTLAKLAIGASGRWLGSSGTAPQWNAPAALTKTDDTNVTLTLGGSASTALLNAASLTLGWTGTLAVSRGGTGLSSFTANGILYASGTGTLATSSGLTFNGTNFATTGSASGASLIATTSGVKVTGGPTGYGGDEIAMQTTSATYSAISTQMTGQGVLYFDHRGTSNQGSFIWRNGTGGANTLASLGGTTNDFTLNSGNLFLSSTSTQIVVGAASGQGGYKATFGNSSTAANLYLASSGSGSYITGVSSASSSNGFTIGHITAVSRFQVQVGGSGGVELSSGGTSWSAMSDERLKDVIEPITSAIDKVGQLRSVIGKYKTDAADKRRSFLIAQDVLKVLPEAVSETTLAKDATDTYLTVAYTDLIPLLVAAINEMSAEIKALKGN